jgi:ASC-1-like (ASCH) protein
MISEFKVKTTNYLENEKLEKCLPWIDTIEEGIKIYHNFYSVNDENKYKIKGFSIKII